MDGFKLHSGRPYGGCAILWLDCLSCKVTPIFSDNTRLCMVKVEFATYTIMLCTIYMPCDSDFDQCNSAIYIGVLNELIRHANDESIDFVISGGDFNTGMFRVKSLHTNSLQTFMNNENFKLCDNHQVSRVDYTYQSSSNGVKSTLDHFMVSENVFQFNCNVSAFMISIIAQIMPSCQHHSIFRWNMLTQRYKTRPNYQLLPLILTNIKTILTSYWKILY